MDIEILRRLHQFHTDLVVLRCDIDAYHDIDDDTGVRGQQHLIMAGLEICGVFCYFTGYLETVVSTLLQVAGRAITNYWR